MSIKTFLVGRMNRVFARADLAPRDDAAHTVGDAAVALDDAPSARAARGRQGPAIVGLEHLGAYRPLVAAIREELTRFVASDLRLHLAIAEHDRFVLTAVDVQSETPEGAELLARFAREFAPEQVKHYLAREVIARLPNASAIDLTQFAGLHAVASEQNARGGAYDDLIAELRSDEPPPPRPFEVTLGGRWAEQESRSPKSAPRAAAGLATPLAGRALAVAVEDAKGARRVQLPVVVPGRRYVIGKDATCDIVIDATYASRRHCEIWLDGGAWWAADCGSTNGIRVEPPAHGGLTRGALLASTGGDGKSLAVAEGAAIVLSAGARGEAAQYARIVVAPPAQPESTEATPVTPIIAAPAPARGLVLMVRMASGERTVELPGDGTPLPIGRSRSQALVVDWAHESVSGHHVDVLGASDEGATVVVHGDNGVTVGDAAHPPGTRFVFRVGETMVLGRAAHDEPACSLTLSRAA
jgi:hypothetical protein